MLFTSDNWAGVHPTILEAIARVNTGDAPPYGNDDETAALKADFEALFGEVHAMGLVATGSAANALALACLTDPWGAVLCHADGHIHLDECGAPEFFTGGGKLVPVAGDAGKLTPDGVEQTLAFFTPQQPHRVTPQVLSLTQGTEAGTVYTLEELKALKVVAENYNLRLHMDGARLGNALVALGCSARDAVRDVGVDVLTFGATKNGCLAAETILFLNPAGADQLQWRQKRAGQVFSKNRFFAAQWRAYLQDDLWLQLASEANDAAKSLRDILSQVDRLKLPLPTEINEVFAVMDDALVERLRAKGAQFYDWIQPSDPYDGQLRRFVTSFRTSTEDLKQFENELHTA